MPYEFLDDIATADIAFRAWAKDLERTFVQASEAMMNVMVEEIDSIKPREERRVRLQNEALDMLLFDFLQELIYFKDSEGLLLRAREVKIAEEDSPFSLHATVFGESIDSTRHRLRVDVKAVTLHRFRLEKSDEGWEAWVILDI
jgi:SHS2 domain-containing protein